MKLEMDTATLLAWFATFWLFHMFKLFVCIKIKMLILCFAVTRMLLLCLGIVNASALQGSKVMVSKVVKVRRGPFMISLSCCSAIWEYYIFA